MSFGSIAARAELDAVGVERFTERDYRPGLVTHVVLFRFAADATSDDIAEVGRRFHALAATTRADGEPYILSVVSGEQQSSEDAGHGFQWAFAVGFASFGDRNYYIGRPVVEAPGFYDEEHDGFKSWVGPFLAPGDDGVLVFDFQS
ncbi:MAG: Dabb family protein [Glaciihabitans sp.]|nr:Dabb family protein [Glaciihabitans sp.]